jgi:tetratricopeptide (TPR) repeat protein
LIEDSEKRTFSRILASATLSAFLLAACATHLGRAKLYYSKGQEFARTYRTVEAAASYKRALIEAGKAAGSGSSAQAFMVKGLAETSLERWADAETSFLRASALGFPEGQEWAADVSRLGLAISLAELGFEDAALRSLAGLLDRSTFKPVVPEAARRWLDLSLARAANMDDKDRAKSLAAIVRTLEKLVDNDFACGFHHYLLSQALSHALDYRRSFEEAAVARGLGLPSEKALRDNDLQAVFCYEALKKELPPGDWGAFEALYARWTKKWGWKDARTPGWKKE